MVLQEEACETEKETNEFFHTYFEVQKLKKYAIFKDTESFLDLAGMWENQSWQQHSKIIAVWKDHPELEMYPLSKPTLNCFW